MLCSSCPQSVGAASHRPPCSLQIPQGMSKFWRWFNKLLASTHQSTTKMIEFAEHEVTEPMLKIIASVATECYTKGYIDSLIIICKL